MEIPNPGVVLPLILLVMFIAMALCLVVIVRFLMRPRKKPSEGEQPADKKARQPGGVSRLTRWLSEPVAGSPADRSIESSVSPGVRAGVPARGSVPGNAAHDLEDGIEIMRVLRLGTLGQLVVEADGKRYHRLSEIVDGAAGRRVLLAIQELNDFAGPHLRARLPETHRVRPDSLSESGGADVTAEQRAFLDQIRTSGAEEQAPETRATLGPYWRRGLRRTKPAADPETESQPGTFVDELEQLLQERLLIHPTLEGRSIHFRGTPVGDLTIEVDGGQYTAIDEVPAADVVALLKETVRTWEQR